MALLFTFLLTISCSRNLKLVKWNICFWVLCLVTKRFDFSSSFNKIFGLVYPCIDRYLHFCGILIQSNSGLAACCSSFSGVQRRPSASFRVLCLAPTSGERNGSVLMETDLKEAKDDSKAVDVDNNPTVAGGVKDVYGEDRATEDQLVTPWSVSVAR